MAVLTTVSAAWGADATVQPPNGHPNWHRALLAAPTGPGSEQSRSVRDKGTVWCLDVKSGAGCIRNDERCPDRAGLSAHLHAPAIGVGDGLADRKAEPGPASPRVARRIRA